MEDRPRCTEGSDYKRTGGQKLFWGQPEEAGAPRLLLCPVSILNSSKWSEPESSSYESPLDSSVSVVSVPEHSGPQSHSEKVMH